MTVDEGHDVHVLVRAGFGHLEHVANSKGLEVVVPHEVDENRPGAILRNELTLRRTAGVIRGTLLRLSLLPLVHSRLIHRPVRELGVIRRSAAGDQPQRSDQSDDEPNHRTRAHRLCLHDCARIVVAEAPHLMHPYSPPIRAVGLGVTPATHPRNVARAC